MCNDLKAKGIAYRYEPFRIPYIPSKVKHYTPDVLLLANYIIIETKGRFTTADRQKHIEIKAQHPDRDIRFVFSNSRSRISKQSQTTYAAWCGHKGFLYADKAIPPSWLTEPMSAARKAAVEKLLKCK